MNIYYIAERSGVSIATVSRVINGGKNVSQKTKDRVLAVMSEEEYIPNAFARGLGLNTMRMIGILCTDVSDYYYAKAVSLVENSLRGKGFDVLLCCTGNGLEDKKKYLKLLIERRVDAVMLIGSAFKENSDNSHIETAAKQVPVIIINGLVELPNVTCILCDEKSAVEQNIKLLFEQECRRILYLYDTMTYSGVQKLDGYREAYKEYGIATDDDLLVRVPKNLAEAEEKVTSLLQSIDFDAVMASEDLLAIAAQKALSKAQKNVPVIGFNNSILAQCATPALTSVDNMSDTLCPTAVNLLCHILEGKQVPNKIIISAALIERETFRKQ